ncbi:MAG: glycosyltransferase family 4 protein [Acidimicrobiia bacterium]|nr:glycosyltransferase family 4 protein [Acidimicrobiia bacterium]
MHVAWDCTFALSPRTGVGTFASAVLDRLAARPDVDVTAYAVAWRQSAAVAAQLPPGVAMARRCDVLSPLHTRAAWKRGDLPPIEWVTGPVDVVHSPNFVAPPARRAAMVATVHDLTFVHHPEHCTADTRKYPPLIARAISRGAWIHTVSRAIADEVIEVFDAPPERVVVVHNATDPLPPARAADGHRLAGGHRYVVALGTVEPRKNLPRLVAAWDRLADDDPDLRLVVAGADGWGSDGLDGAVTVARHAERIVRLGWVDAAERSALLRGATVLAYPSLYEGFGLPPLEAMSVGVPVVAGRAGALPEVVADAAMLVDPLDVDAIAEGLAGVLDDEANAAKLVARGHARVADFSWDRTTEELVELYRRAAAER